MFQVMIVDDEPLILDGIKDLIHKMTLPVPISQLECAYDGVEALEKMESFHPDLLITDLQMPEMSGLELIEASRDKRLKRFVILTGFESFEYAREAIRLKVDNYLLKPLNKLELEKCLSKAGLEIEQQQTLEDIVRSNESKDASTLRELTEFIRTHYMESLSLDDVANHLHFHPNYACRWFKQELGTSFVNYLHSVRMEKVKQLMALYPEKSLQDIAETVGYMNARHFYKVFKKYYGVTPGEYKNTMGI